MTDDGQLFLECPDLPLTQAIDGGRGEQAVAGEGLIPLGEVEIAGDDGGSLLVTLGDQVVQIFVGGRAQRFQPEVVESCCAH